MLLVIRIFKMHVLSLSWHDQSWTGNPVEEPLFMQGYLPFPVLLLPLLSIISALREQPVTLGSISSKCWKRSKYGLQDALSCF